MTNNSSKQHSAYDSIQLTVAAASLTSLSITWCPQQAGTMQEILHFQWDNERLKVLLYGTAAALPVSSLMHASVRRAFTDFGCDKLQLPQTPAGQKVVKSQRLGGISPGHPTFEAALRSITAATPGRGAGTPGPSRHAHEAATDKMQSPVLTFAARLQDVADSPPKPAVLDRPRTRLKQASGKVPMRAFKLSANQSAAKPSLIGQPAAIPGFTGQPATARSLTGKAARTKGAVSTVYQLSATSSADRSLSVSSTASTTGFSHFHSRYMSIA